MGMSQPDSRSTRELACHRPAVKWYGHTETVRRAGPKFMRVGELAPPFGCCSTQVRKMVELSLIVKVLTSQALAR